MNARPEGPLRPWLRWLDVPGDVEDECHRRSPTEAWHRQRSEACEGGGDIDTRRDGGGEEEECLLVRRKDGELGARSA